MSVWRQGSRSPAWWLSAALGAFVFATDLYGQIDGDLVGPRAVLFFLAMGVGLLTGLWVWAWRPKTRMGPLMTWWPIAWLAGDLTVPYPDSRFISTVGLALFTIGPIVLAQMTLSYPNGQLVGRLAWVYIFILGYAAQVIQNIGNLLYYDARGCPVCVPRAPSYLFIGGTPPISLEHWNKAWSIEIIAALPIGLAILWRKYFRASRGARRTFGPLAVTATIVTCASWIVLFGVVFENKAALENVTSLLWVLTAGALAVAVTSLIGLAVTRRARGIVGDLVVELDKAGAGGTREALARAIGDPTLELALWLPEAGKWVDQRGREMTLPEVGPRSVTLIGERLGAIVHDPIFLDQPAMLEAAGSAARFALENERLQAQLRRQLAELRDSRARIVRAGDSERRRLERDLHDGAQQRLLGVGMALQLLRGRLDRDEPATDLLDEMEREMTAALDELRELARGIHPAVLTDQGLVSALRTLAERAPIPVEVDAIDERLPHEIETAVYFIVAEALVNVTKYAHASKVWVRLARDERTLLLEIRDDGVGGARMNGGGTGLRGLADRAGSLDGSLTVESDAGRGTRIVADIPCAW